MGGGAGCWKGFERWYHTRERLLAPGCAHAAEQPGDVLDGALVKEVAPHAFLDRLLHRSHVLNIKGHSHRVCDLEAVLKEGQAGPPFDLMALSLSPRGWAGRAAVLRPDRSRKTGCRLIP